MKNTAKIKKEIHVLLDLIDSLEDPSLTNMRRHYLMSLAIRQHSRMGRLMKK